MAEGVVFSRKEKLIMKNKLDLPNKIRKALHPLLLKAVKGRIYFPIEILNNGVVYVDRKSKKNKKKSLQKC